LLQDTAGDHHVDGKIQQATLLDETDLEWGLRANDRGRRNEAYATRHSRDGMSPAHKPITLFRRHSPPPDLAAVFIVLTAAMPAP